MRKTILLLALFGVVGCQMTVPNPIKPEPVAPKIKDNCWEHLARLVEKNKIPDTDLLIKTVDNLRDEDAISDADKTAFYEKFQGIKEKQRPIDPRSDAALLRGL